MDCNNLCLIGFFILIFGLVLIILKMYNQQGDINHMSKILNYCQMDKKYNCPKLILSRLYQILHFKFNYVYRIYFTLLSVLSSVLINYILSHIYKFKISLSSILVCSLIIFITLEVPHRYITVHHNKSVEIEGTCLISYLNNKFI